MSFGPGTHLVGAHVQGVVSIFAGTVARTADNWVQLNAF